MGAEEDSLTSCIPSCEDIYGDGSKWCETGQMREHLNCIDSDAWFTSCDEFLILIGQCM